jgi:P pilus assembly chaperone PapD
MYIFRVLLLGLFTFLQLSAAQASPNTAETAGKLLWRLGSDSESIIVQNTEAFPVSISQVVTLRKSEKALLGEKIMLAVGERKVIPATFLSFGTSLFFTIVNDRGDHEDYQTVLQSAVSTHAVPAFDPRPVME